MTSKVSVEEVTRFLDAWFLVRQVIQAWNFNRFQGTGLSATQFMTLNLLPSEETGVAMGELARRMNLKAATVAKTVDSLEARKLVVRRRSSADKRVISVQVTPEGMELQNSANGHFRRQIEELFSSMSTDERAGLVVGLERMVQAAAQLPKASGLSVDGSGALQE